MKFYLNFFLAFISLLVIVMSAPVDDPKYAKILKYENNNIGVNAYNFEFETSDGIHRQETAQLKNIGTENEAISVKGTIEWIDGDGRKFKLDYIADENGYRAEADHLPVV